MPRSESLKLIDRRGHAAVLRPSEFIWEGNTRITASVREAVVEGDSDSSTGIVVALTVALAEHSSQVLRDRLPHWRADSSLREQSGDGITSLEEACGD